MSRAAKIVLAVYMVLGLAVSIGIGVLVRNDSEGSIKTNATLTSKRGCEELVTERHSQRVLNRALIDRFAIRSNAHRDAVELLDRYLPEQRCVIDSPTGGYRRVPAL